MVNYICLVIMEALPILQTMLNFTALLFLVLFQVGMKHKPLLKIRSRILNFFGKISYFSYENLKTKI